MTLSRGFGIVSTLVLSALANAGTGLAEPWRQLGPEGGTIDLLAFAPGDHHVVYAATAACCPPPPSLSYEGGRIFRSADGGTTWSSASQGLPVLRVLSLMADPVQPEVVYAGNDDGVWKTTNGGKSWIGFPGRLPGLAVTALAIDLNNSSRIYAGTDFSGVTGSPPGRVYRSDDGGRRWVERSSGLPSPASVLALAVDPAASDALVAILTDFGDCNTPRFWRSSDRGRSWHEARLVGLPYIPGVVCTPSSPFSGFQLDPSSHKLYVAIDGAGVLVSNDFGESWIGSVSSAEAGGPAYVVVSSTGQLYGLFGPSGFYPPATFLETSSDGGATWRAAGKLPSDARLLAVDPSSPGRVLAGAVHGGLLLTDDGGASWSPANAGLLATTITAVAVPAEKPQTFYVGTVDGGLFASDDGGARWKPVDFGLCNSYPGLCNSHPRHITALAVTERELWTGIDRGLLRSRDGGSTWDWVSVDTCAQVTWVWQDPASATVLVVKWNDLDSVPCDYDCSILESRDSGASWSCLKGDRFGGLSSFVIDPADPRLLYAVNYEGPQYRNSGRVSSLWRSMNRGRTFQQLAYGTSLDFSILEVSPVHHQLLWAGTYEHGVSKSVDQGASWSVASRGLAGGQVVALVADPEDAASAYAEIDGRGVFGTHDNGASWRPLGEGLPEPLLDWTLAIGKFNGHRVLYAGTAGAGLFALPIP